MEKPQVISHTWDSIRSDVLKVNKTLAETIDSINPGKEFTLYEAIYPYGATIIKDGQLFLPNKAGSLVPLVDATLTQQIRDDLAYASGGMPAGILLENSIQESIQDNRNRQLPLAIVSQGSIFALWKWLDEAPAFHPVKIFNITAGASDIFMLANIGDLSLHKNLRREYNIRTPAPKQLEEQWPLFKEIVNSPAADCNWRNRLLFFPGKWMENVKSDPAWQSLYLYMLEQVWKKSSFERNQMFFDFALSCAQANRNLKPNPYLTDTVRHLNMIALGAASGFGVARDNSAAPIELLQDVYVNCYGLKNYLPTIFQPTHFNISTSTEPVYYSLQIPTTLEFSPKSRKLSTTLNDLREIRHIVNTFYDELRKGKLKVEDTILGILADTADFRYFHTKPDIHGEIELTEELLKTHPQLADCDKKYGKKEVAVNGTFIRGCVQIASKKPD